MANANQNEIGCNKHEFTGNWDRPMASNIMVGCCLDDPHLTLLSENRTMMRSLLAGVIAVLAVLVISERVSAKAMTYAFGDLVKKSELIVEGVVEKQAEINSDQALGTGCHYRKRSTFRIAKVHKGAAQSGDTIAVLSHETFICNASRLENRQKYVLFLRRMGDAWFDFGSGQGTRAIVERGPMGTVVISARDFKGRGQPMQEFLRDLTWAMGGPTSKPADSELSGDEALKLAKKALAEAKFDLDGYQLTKTKRLKIASDIIGVAYKGDPMWLIDWAKPEADGKSPRPPGSFVGAYVHAYSGRIFLYPEEIRLPKLWVALNVSEPVVQPGCLAAFQVRFVMFNDGDKAIDPKEHTWRLNVNGKDHPGSRQVFRRVLGREGLLPGGDLELGYGLGDWFKEPGPYRLIWKGENFESAPVFFRVLPQEKRRTHADTSEDVNGTTKGVPCREYVTPFTKPHGEVVDGLFVTLEVDKAVYRADEHPFYRVTVSSCSTHHTLWFATTMMGMYHMHLRLLDEKGNALRRRSDVPIPNLTYNYSLMHVSLGEFYGTDKALNSLYKLGPGKYRLRVGVRWDAYPPDKLGPASMRHLLADPDVKLWTGAMQSNEVAFEIRE